MDRKALDQMSVDNAAALCSRIREDADQQVAEIVAKQRADAGALIQQAQAQAQREKIAVLAAVEKELGKFREKSSSALNLEKRRLLLEGKNTFVKSVFERVAREAEAFRDSPAYAEFLRQAVVEGAQVVEVPALEVFYAPADRDMFTGDFVQAAEQLCSQALRMSCQLRMSAGDFSDIGVIVATQDGRMIFDNRFPARLARMYDQVYAELLKEA